jgi:hypothetical protein
VSRKEESGKVYTGRGKVYTGRGKVYTGRGYCFGAPSELLRLRSEWVSEVTAGLWNAADFLGLRESRKQPRKERLKRESRNDESR